MARYREIRGQHDQLFDFLKQSLQYEKRILEKSKSGQTVNTASFLYGVNEVRFQTIKILSRDELEDIVSVRSSRTDITAQVLFKFLTVSDKHYSPNNIISVRGELQIRDRSEVTLHCGRNFPGIQIPDSDQAVIGC